MNERDSEAVAAQLIAHGHTLAASEDSADVILLNTCSVRDSAEQKALGKMQAVNGVFRSQRKPVILGFLGCMAQARGAELLQQIPQVNLVLGTQKFHRVAEYVDRLLSGQDTQICNVDEEEQSHAMMREHLVSTSGRATEVTAFVSIMQGCNQHCTFCIVPHTRGEERSRSIEDIVAECQTLATGGVKEITLLGQIVTSFGRRDIPDRDGKTAFVQLLEAVSAIEGLERIRFTAPHPKGFGEDLIDAYARLPKLCSSAHMPIQSGSNRILKLMHRGYPVERCLEIIRRLREIQPGMGVTTDIIVGFPGETEEDFQQTLDLVRQAQFDNAFLFKYSPRQGTPASDMPDQLTQEVKEERHARILSLVNEIAMKRYEALVGKTVQVLVDGPSRRNPARLAGRTSCNKIVVFEGQDRHRGTLMELKVERAGSFTLYGTPSESAQAGSGNME